MLVITKRIRTWLHEHMSAAISITDDQARQLVSQAIKSGRLTSQNLADMKVDDHILGEGGGSSGGQFTPPAGMTKSHEIFGGSNGGGTPAITDGNDPHAHTRVKNPSEMYCHTKSMANISEPASRLRIKTASNVRRPASLSTRRRAY